MHKFNGPAEQEELMVWVCQGCRSLHHQEDAARYCCATGRECEKCEKMTDYRSERFCRYCIRENDARRWADRPKYPWPKNLTVTPVVWEVDRFLFDRDEAASFIAERITGGDKPETIELEIYKEDPPPRIDLGELLDRYCAEGFGFDEDGSISAKLNEMIAMVWKPVLHSTGKAVDWRTFPRDERL